MAEQILDVLVPDMVEQLVKLPNTVSQDRIRQRPVEQIVDTSDPQVVEKLVVVFRVFSQDRIQQRTVEQTIPATSLAEMIVEVACHSGARKHATGCEHGCSACRQYSRSGEAQNHQADRAENHHPGEDQPGDQAR